MVAQTIIRADNSRRVYTERFNILPYGPYGEREDTRSRFTRSRGGVPERSDTPRDPIHRSRDGVTSCQSRPNSLSPPVDIYGESAGEQLMGGGALMPRPLSIDSEFEPQPVPSSSSSFRPPSPNLVIKVTIERNNSNESRNPSILRPPPSRLFLSFSLSFSR